MTTPRARIMVHLAAFPLLATCGTEPTARITDLEALGAPLLSSAFSDWSAPASLGPLVNSASTELEVSVTRNGLSLYLASNRGGNFDIWVSKRARVDDPWGAPQTLGSTINTSSREQAPFLSLDGHRLYFFSDRSGGFGGTDLYVSRRRDKQDDFGWEPPVNLGGGVNSSFNETLPVHLEDDLTEMTTLYFSSNRPGIGAGDIFASTLQPDGTFGSAALVAELSSPRRDRILALRRDGLEIFLASDRPGPDPTPFDLWVATRATTRDRWSPPVKLGALVNSAADEGGAALSFDGTSLYFTSDRPGGFGNHDIYLSTRARLKEPEQHE